MTRVSLTESYDDRSVISKLNEMDKRVKENASVVTSAEASARQSAQSAQETADRFAGSVGAVVQNANAQINASKAQVDQAKSEVDETVTTVAQAVQTANQASASAQASAQTVTGYGDRLQRAETDIQTLDGETEDLYRKDGENVKLSPSGAQTIHKPLEVSDSTWGVPTFTVTGIGNSAVVSVGSSTQPVRDGAIHYGPLLTFVDTNKSPVGGIRAVTVTDNKGYLQLGGATESGSTQFNVDIRPNGVTIPTPPTGAASGYAVNKAYVESTVDGVNNIAHKTGGEIINATNYATLPLISKKTGATNVIYGIFKIGPASDTNSYYYNMIFSERYGFALARITVTPSDYATSNVFEKLDVTSTGGSSYELGFTVDGNGDLWFSHRKTAQAGQSLGCIFVGGQRGTSSWHPLPTNEVVTLTDYGIHVIGRV